MRDYRSLWLGEWRDTIGKLRDKRLAEYREARQNLNDLREMQRSANRIRSTIDKYRANKKTRAIAVVAELEGLLQKYPDSDFLTKELKRIQSKIGKLESCYQKLCKQYASLETRCTEREEHMRWVQTHFAYSIKRYLPIEYSTEEIITQSNRNGSRLHVFFGGLGNPLGVGHGHLVFRQNDGELVYQRNPRPQRYLRLQRRFAAA